MSIRLKQAILWIVSSALLTLGCGYDDPTTPAGAGTTGTGVAGTGTTGTGGTSNLGGRPAGGTTSMPNGGTGASSVGGATPAGGIGGAPLQTGGTEAGGSTAGGGAAGMPPVAGSGPGPSAGRGKPRLLVQTDGEVDDRSTMVRFLMYASDFDLEGIVQTNSRYQKEGHSKERWVEKEIELYAQALPNLRKHNKDYPDPEKISSLVKVGNETQADLFVAPASMKTKETVGSKHIVDMILKDDPRPLHIATWGGANTLAYALYTLKQTAPEKLAEKVPNLWVYCIWYQDNGGKWIEENIPGINIYDAYRWDNVWDYQSLTGPSPDEVKAFMTKEWLNEHVKKDHGALGAYTPQSYVSEGDTPSFLPHIANGLDQHVDYTWGGWGGRPVRKNNSRAMSDKGLTSDDGNEYKSFWRWIPTVQNDFQARMDWAVADSYEKANHNPVAQVSGALDREVAGGETVMLDASASTDPDGNTLSFKWWQYYDADTASAKLTIANDTTPTASFTVPSEPGKNLHIILEATDNGSPALTNYKRVVLTIK